MFGAKKKKAEAVATQASKNKETKKPGKKGVLSLFKTDLSHTEMEKTKGGLRAYGESESLEMREEGELQQITSAMGDLSGNAGMISDPYAQAPSQGYGAISSYSQPEPAPIPFNDALAFQPEPQPEPAPAPIYEAAPAPAPIYEPAPVPAPVVTEPEPQLIAFNDAPPFQPRLPEPVAVDPEPVLYTGDPIPLNDARPLMPEPPKPVELPVETYQSPEPMGYDVAVQPAPEQFVPYFDPAPVVTQPPVFTGGSNLQPQIEAQGVDLSSGTVGITADGQIASIADVTRLPAGGSASPEVIYSTTSSVAGAPAPRQGIDVTDQVIGRTSSADGYQVTRGYFDAETGNYRGYGVEIVSGPGAGPVREPAPQGSVPVQGPADQPISYNAQTAQAGSVEDAGRSGLAGSEASARPPIPADPGLPAGDPANNVHTSINTGELLDQLRSGQSATQPLTPAEVDQILASPGVAENGSVPGATSESEYARNTATYTEEAYAYAIEGMQNRGRVPAGYTITPPEPYEDGFLVTIEGPNGRTLGTFTYSISEDGRTMHASSMNVPDPNMQSAGFGKVLMGEALSNNPGVEVIDTHYGSSNQNTFNRNVANGMDPVTAAQNTPAQGIRNHYGYTDFEMDQQLYAERNHVVTTVSRPDGFVDAAVPGNVSGASTNHSGPVGATESSLPASTPVEPAPVELHPVNSTPMSASTGREPIDAGVLVDHGPGQTMTTPRPVEPAIPTEPVIPASTPETYYDFNGAPARNPAGTAGTPEVPNGGWGETPVSGGAPEVPNRGWGSTPVNGAGPEVPNGGWGSTPVGEHAATPAAAETPVGATTPTAARTGSPIDAFESTSSSPMTQTGDGLGITAKGVLGEAAGGALGGAAVEIVKGLIEGKSPEEIARSLPAGALEGAGFNVAMSIVEKVATRIGSAGAGAAALEIGGAVLLGYQVLQEAVTELAPARDSIETVLRNSGVGGSNGSTQPNNSGVDYNTLSAPQLAQWGQDLQAYLQRTDISAENRQAAQNNLTMVTNTLGARQAAAGTAIGNFASTGGVVGDMGTSTDNIHGYSYSTDANGHLVVTGQSNGDPNGQMLAGVTVNGQRNNDQMSERDSLMNLINSGAGTPQQLAQWTARVNEINQNYNDFATTQTNNLTNNIGSVGQVAGGYQTNSQENQQNLLNGIATGAAGQVATARQAQDVQAISTLMSSSDGRNLLASRDGMDLILNTQAGQAILQTQAGQEAFRQIVQSMGAQGQDVINSFLGTNSTIPSGVQDFLRTATVTSANGDQITFQAANPSTSSSSQTQNSIPQNRGTDTLGNAGGSIMGAGSGGAGSHGTVGQGDPDAALRAANGMRTSYSS